MAEYAPFNIFMSCAGTAIVVFLLLALAVVVLRWLAALVFPLSGSGGEGRYAGYYDDLPPPAGAPASTHTSAPAASAAPAPAPSQPQRPRSMIRSGCARPPANAGWEEGRSAWEE